MVFCNVKKICWELLEHLNFLSCSMVTNKKSGFCKSTFDNLQETSIYNVASYCE